MVLKKYNFNLNYAHIAKKEKAEFQKKWVNFT